MDPSYLVGSVKAEDDEDRRSIEGLVRDLVPYCEAHGWSDNEWSFRSDFTQKKYLLLEEGDTFDLMRSIFPMLLDLRHFYDATFWMVIHCGDEARKCYSLEPSMVAMCSALGMGIDIFTPACTSPDTTGTGLGE